MSNKKILTIIKPMIPQPPRVPVLNEKKEKLVRYYEIDVENLPAVTLIPPEIYQYYITRWEDKQGYYITDDKNGADYVIFTDYDILENIIPVHGIRKVDGDEIFFRFNMNYDNKILNI